MNRHFPGTTGPTKAKPRPIRNSNTGGVLGSLKTNNGQDYMHSPLHDSAEALLLLNNAQPDFGHSTQEGKENEMTVGIPITAPVPLSYTVRGKEALRSILSIGEELDDVDDIEEQHQFTVKKPLSDFGITAAPSIGRPTFNNGQDINISFGGQIHPVNTESGKPLVVIRSITPSTLIALTEPCLMAWCLDTDEETLQTVPANITTHSLNYFASSSDNAGHMDTRYVMPMTRNLWGY